MRFDPFAPASLFRGFVGEDGVRVMPDAGRPDAHGFADLLFHLAAYEKPIVISGTGIATSEDSFRCRFLLDHIDAVGSAIREGVDVRGYFHYSLLDGFEWSHGHTARFGLVHIDRESLARTPNPSAYLYKEICEANEIRPGAVRRFCPDWAGAASLGVVPA
jgi:beta-glucosidase